MSRGVQGSVVEDEDTFHHNLGFPKWWKRGRNRCRRVESVFLFFLEEVFLNGSCFGGWGVVMAVIISIWGGRLLEQWIILTSEEVTRHGIAEKHEVETWFNKACSVKEDKDRVVGYSRTIRTVELVFRNQINILNCKEIISLLEM